MYGIVKIGGATISNINNTWHRDHYVGAQFIKDNYKAKIAMSETDYKIRKRSSTL